MTTSGRLENTLLEFQDSGNVQARIIGNSNILTLEGTSTISAITVASSTDTSGAPLNITSGAGTAGTGGNITLTAGTGTTNGSININSSLVVGGKALTWKTSVSAVADTDIDITSAPSSIDSYTLVLNDRVLLTNQSPDSENGIYIFNGTSNAMTRSNDAQTETYAAGTGVYSTNGTSYEDTLWFCSSGNTVEFGDSGLTFTQFVGGGGGGGSPGAPNNAIQYRVNSTTFGGDASFLFTPSTTTMNIGSASGKGNITSQGDLDILVGTTGTLTMGSTSTTVVYPRTDFSNSGSTSLVNKGYVDSAISSGVAGNNTEVQFNKSGSFGATTMMTISTSGTTATLGLGIEAGTATIQGRNATTASTNGAALTLTSGSGNTSGNSGDLSLSTPNANATSGSNAGDISITGGDSNTTADTQAGNVLLYGGNGGGNISLNHSNGIDDGSVTIIDGGDVILGISGGVSQGKGGDATSGTAGQGGDTRIFTGQGGNGTAGNANGGLGGSVVITCSDGGDGNGSGNPGNGGSITVTGGDGGTGGSGNATGGDITFITGNGQGTGVDGNIDFGASGDSSGRTKVFMYGIRTGVSGNALGITSNEIVDTVSLRQYKIHEVLANAESGHNPDSIYKLKPKYFTWKTDGKRDFGLVVEDALEEGLHQYIFFDEKKGPRNYKDRALIAGLINTVQMQKEEIDTLKNDNETLKLEIKELKEQIQSIVKLLTS